MSKTGLSSLPPTQSEPLTDAGPNCARATGSAKAPSWLLKREKITQRQWRARKRADLKNLVAAFGRYRMGCAYCPGKDGEVGQIQDALAALTKSHAAKAWK